MSEYTEMLNKIFISMNGVTVSDDVIYYRVAESVGFIAIVFGAKTLTNNCSECAHGHKHSLLSDNSDRPPRTEIFIMNIYNKF